MILIIGHEAGLTGAPIVLLSLSRWMSEVKKEKLVFLIVKEGPLCAEYEKLGEVMIWEPEYRPKPLLSRVKNNIIGQSEEKRKHDIINHILSLRPRLIISNTIVNGRILENFATSGINIVTIVHELESVIQLYNLRGMVEGTLKNSSYYIAVSDAVKHNLVLNHNVPSQKISIGHGFIDYNNLQFTQKKKNVNRTFSFMVGACGNLVYRKGPDVFIKVADEVINKRKVNDVVFSWVGGCKQTLFYYELIEDIRKLKLENYMQLVGEVPNPWIYYKNMDILILTSREDPFPLVNIEAAWFGLPIVCFEGSGGSAEFVTDDVGFVLPYLDTTAMAEKVIELKTNEGMRRRMSDNIKAKAAKFTIDIKAAELYEIVLKFKSSS